MPHSIMIAPAGLGSGLTTTVLGLVHALEQQGIRVGFFKPIAQTRNGDSNDRSVAILRSSCAVSIAEPIPMREAEHLVSSGRQDQLLEQIIERFEDSCADAPEVVVIEGLVPTMTQPYANTINSAIARALDAEVVLVAAPGLDGIDAIEDHLDIVARFYGGAKEPRVLGCIMNKLDAPLDREGNPRPEIAGEQARARSLTLTQIEAQATLFDPRFRLLGGIPWDSEMVAPRVRDLTDYLEARILYAGDINHRRVSSIVLCGQTLPHMVRSLKPGTLIVTPGDREDIILAACLAANNGVALAGLVLTGGYTPSPELMTLCEGALRSGLPIVSVVSDSWQTAQNIPRDTLEIPVDDLERIAHVKEFTAAHIDADWIASLRGQSGKVHLSPAAFRYQLVARARAAQRNIVLPEGSEPRTVRAAALCAERGIARCTLLGDPSEIERIADNLGIALGDKISILDPEQIRERYIARLLELRAHKGITELQARDELQDNVVLGTLMLELGEVDGLVSGAVHTTANTIRPALQLIRTAPGTSLVSSIFFMLLPEQVLVYGDCAINPDPSAEELADIAIQSADSASAFGIEPRVAMISYSTGVSGQGADVDKVRKATALAQRKRPDLLIDGPLQYDAAIMESVARSKAPNSPVAGRATVFIFPDLNTGNTTYKAVQRSAEVISIGPMLQGMRKPVNDLSRGALVEDILFTIALTAIQAAQNPADRH
ncbi:phosphate acetyltransferase [Marinobacterium zhoushanense]|uniref:Phosphate acetyltransferase n=1 Tax=Marinobacterium zhoushanense TaxID=1679163 RepID=A0ABQ1KLB9_9GAMM|nr:phosphate acetyltransferase [Marinobacterium zhoushanense]GGC03913.1 phosphate acetyltransferase [Marinobacterium zhoushanense]